MKNFGLGLLLGGIAGLGLSFIKDEQGKRIGAPLKEEIASFKADAEEFSTSLHKLQNARTEFEKHLPTAARALDDISTELEQYQDHTSRTLDQIENQAKKLEEHSQLENS